MYIHRQQLISNIKFSLSFTINMHRALRALGDKYCIESCWRAPRPLHIKHNLFHCVPNWCVSFFRITLIWLFNTATVFSSAKTALCFSCIYTSHLPTHKYFDSGIRAPFTIPRPSIHWHALPSAWNNSNLKDLLVHQFDDIMACCTILILNSSTMININREHGTLFAYAFTID